MTEDMQCKIEHLKFTQNVIARMAGNSRQTKKWAIVLVPAIIAFQKFVDPPLLIGFVSLVAFLFAFFSMWYHDANYLRLERVYRKLYETIIGGKDVKKFELNPSPYFKQVDSCLKIARSWSVFWFYFPIFIGLIWGWVSVVLSAA